MNDPIPKECRWPVLLDITGEPDWKQVAYLDALAEAGTMTRACEIAHVSHHTVSGWRRDQVFVDAEKVAQGVVADRLESVALSRALNPDDKWGHVLNIFMLKGLRPQKYRDNPPPLPPGDTPAQTINILNLVTADPETRELATELFRRISGERAALVSPESTEDVVDSP